MKEKTIVPTNLLDWPRVCELLPEQKLILLGGLWAGRYTNWIGVCGVPVKPLAATLGLDPTALQTGIKTLETAELVICDWQTGEIFVRDWFRFHTFGSINKVIARREFQKIQSSKIKEVIRKIGPGWLDHETKTIDKPPENDTMPKNHEVKSQSQSQSQSLNAAAVGGLQKIGTAYVRLENPQDASELRLLLQIHTVKRFEKAAKRIAEAGKQPFPSNFKKMLSKLKAEEDAENAKTRLALQEAAAKAAAEKQKAPQEEALAIFDSLSQPQKDDLLTEFKKSNAARNLKQGPIFDRMFRTFVFNSLLKPE